MDIFLYALLICIILILGMLARYLLIQEPKVHELNNLRGDLVRQIHAQEMIALHELAKESHAILMDDPREIVTDYILSLYNESIGNYEKYVRLSKMAKAHLYYGVRVKMEKERGSPVSHEDVNLKWRSDPKMSHFISLNQAAKTLIKCRAEAENATSEEELTQIRIVFRDARKELAEALSIKHTVDTADES